MGRRPCESTCTAFFASCASEIQQYASLIEDIVPPNCTVTDQAGVPLFPADTYFDQGNQLECSTSNASVAVTCPPPLKPYPRPSCYMECPRQFNTVVEFQAMRYICMVLSMISLALELVLIPAYALFPNSRRWPARLLLYYFIANIIGMIGLQFSWEGRGLWCEAMK